MSGKRPIKIKNSNNTGSIDIALYVAALKALKVGDCSDHSLSIGINDEHGENIICSSGIVKRIVRKLTSEKLITSYKKEGYRHMSARKCKWTMYTITALGLKALDMWGSFQLLPFKPKLNWKQEAIVRRNAMEQAKNALRDGDFESAKQLLNEGTIVSPVDEYKKF